MNQALDENLWTDWLGEARAFSYLEVSEKLTLSELAEWNQLICGTLLADIGHVEVALRNVLNSALARRHSHQGHPGSWLEDPAGELKRMGGGLILSKIDDAKSRARKLKPFFSENDVVAELSLGFWLTLFSSKFRGLQPDLVSAMQGLEGRNVRSITSQLSRFRRLRNRLAHNHRVIHRDLVADWSLVMDVARAVHVDLAGEVERLSRSPLLIEEFTQTIQAKSLPNQT